MVDYKYKNLFFKRNIEKKLKIVTDDGLFVAESSDIAWENFELTESLCSESELRFGSCEPSMVRFQIRNAFIPLSGKWLTITETLEGNTDVPFQYGRYKVFSDVPTADKEYRDIVAYDAMYDILSADMSSWYNALLPNKDSKVTLKQFRKAFIAYFNLDEIVPDGGLANDNMVIEKTIDIMTSSETETEQTSIIGDTLSGKDVITAICEINGCFGHIGRDGKFHYIYLPQAIQGLYPANDLFPADTLYPRDPKGEKIGENGTYIDAQYEDYTVNPISKLQIRQEENDIGLIYGSGDNAYIIQGNFLVYGKSSDQLRTVTENIFTKISGITYIPLKHCEAMGNPCFEVGDPIRMSTKYKLIETYILERTLKGIQALRDTYKSNGVEKYAENINSVRQSILQLKGKTNILTRTIEETRLEMIDMGEGLSNTISITAKELRGELKNTKEGLETQILVTAAGIRTEVSQTYETKTNASSEYTKLSSKIEQTAESITSTVSKTYETKTNASSEYTSIKSSITQESGRISSEIERATKAEQKISGQIVSTSETLSSKIEQTAESITSTVSATYETKTNASSEYTSIKSSITQNANSIVSEVSRASSAEDALSSRITQTESSIELKVSKGNVSSQLSLESGQVTLKSNRFVLEATNCSISADGTVTANKLKATNCDISGKITATSGKIAGFTIENTNIHYGKRTFNSGDQGIYIGADGISIGYGGSTRGAFSVSSSGEVKINSALGSIEIQSFHGINFATSSSSIKLLGSDVIYFESVKTTICAQTSVLGKSGGAIGFFGSSGSSKKKVTRVSSADTATTSSVASKINELIDALVGYGLITII